MVEEAPWVMMTTRGVEVFLGEEASLTAISVMSLVCRRRVASQYDGLGAPSGQLMRRRRGGRTPKLWLSA